MSPSSSLSVTDVQRHRTEFPALTNKTYFNYGGQGPMPQTAMDAIAQFHQRLQVEGPFSNQVNRWLVQVSTANRQAMADTLGVAADTISLTEDVTVGCNIPLWGIQWQANDHILMTDCEHPGVIGAVQEVSRRFGVTVSTCPVLATAQGGDPAEVILSHLRPNTRLLIVSHVLWNTGQVLPLGEIAHACHAHHPNPVLVLVDAAQSVGMLPLNLEDLAVDFYAFTGHKWWCGPAGLGGLYVRPEARQMIHPTFIGWRSVTKDARGNPTGWQPNGQCFEVATSDYALMAGLQVAIAHHQSWGTAEQRYQRICQLSQRLWQALGELPQIQLICAQPPASGLVSFQILDHGEPSPTYHAQLVNALEEQGYLLRTLLDPNCVRACLHYFSLETEIDQLVTWIQRWLQSL